jgi:tRNA threonylcarbamoyladenosine biosynthesis protein TsaE
VVLRSLDDTRELAARLIEMTTPGSLLLLSGPLGAGKTTLTGMLARALGSEAAVSSPTYTLVHEYPTPAGPLIHVDAYRLEGADALAQLGLDDYLDRSRLVVVEWGERLAEQYPDAFLLRMERRGEERRATLHRPGDGGKS